MINLIIKLIIVILLCLLLKGSAGYVDSPTRDADKG